MLWPRSQVDILSGKWSRCASVLPAGPIDDDVSDRFLNDVREGLTAGMASGGWGTVYLSLHGAAITLSGNWLRELSQR
jgi:hypothetical protein